MTADGKCGMLWGTIFHSLEEIGIKKENIYMEFRELITFEESIALINEVFTTVFDFDDMTGSVKYLPEVYDYAFRLACAKYYGGYALVDDETDYITAMRCDPFDGEINLSQISGIKFAIDEKIEIQKAEMSKGNITVTSILDELIPIISTFLSSVSEKISSVDVGNLNIQLQELNMENLIKTYLDSNFAQSEKNDIVDAKNEQIVLLKNKINQFISRNVRSDKKKR